MEGCGRWLDLSFADCSYIIADEAVNTELKSKHTVPYVRQDITTLLIRQVNSHIEHRHSRCVVTVEEGFLFLHLYTEIGNTITKPLHTYTVSCFK